MLDPLLCNMDLCRRNSEAGEKLRVCDRVVVRLPDLPALLSHLASSVDLLISIEARSFARPIAM
jgi:hypothetical protein